MILEAGKGHGQHFVRGFLLDHRNMPSRRGSRGGAELTSQLISPCRYKASMSLWDTTLMTSSNLITNQGDANAIPDGFG